MKPGNRQQKRLCAEALFCSHPLNSVVGAASPLWCDWLFPGRAAVAGKNFAAVAEECSKSFEKQAGFRYKALERTPAALGDIFVAQLPACVLEPRRGLWRG